MDGRSSAPLNLVVHCLFNQTNQESTVKASWLQPRHPNGEVVEYGITLLGNVTYRGSRGSNIVEEVGPFEKTVRHTEIEFRSQPPNTVYYLRFVDSREPTYLYFRWFFFLCFQCLCQDKKSNLWRNCDWDLLYASKYSE